MEEFTSQKVLVTGATRGIGKTIAESFLRAGAEIIAIYSGNKEAAADFLAENDQFNKKIELHQCDVSNENEVSDLFSQIEEKHKRLDVLINNAGIREDAVVALMKAQQWQHVIDVNLTGTYLMSKQAVLLMLKNKYGRIINITSPVAHLGFSGQANYAASKAGQVAFSKTLAKEVARKKITVNCVSPGFIATDFISGLGDDQLQAYKKMVPMRRFGTTQDVSNAVLFLAGAGAAYITGSCLEISGGL